MRVLFVKWLMFLMLTAPVMLTGQQYLTYTYGGLTRNYILYLPTNLPDDAPLVFMLHGYSGTAQNIMNFSGMNSLANMNKFAVCYPQGTSDDWGNNFWQVGYDFHQNKDVDDVGFIIALADYLQTNYDLSNKNTFAAGMSNGGDMSYLLACQASETFQAVAPVAGCMMKWIYDSCEPENVIPVFATNGTMDDITWWDGDINNSDGWGAYMGVEDAIDFWSELNETSGFESVDLPDTDPNDGSHVVSEKHIHGNYNHEVWLHKLIDGGHDWPGAWGNMDIDASEEIWNFFDWVMMNSVAAVESVNNIEILIYPNPANSFFNIEFDNSDKLFYTLYDIYGRIMLKENLDSHTSKIDIRTLPNGLYLLHLNNKIYKVLKTE